MKNLLFSPALKSFTYNTSRSGFLKKLVLICTILFLTALKFSHAQEALNINNLSPGPDNPDTIPPLGVSNYDLPTGPLDIYPNPFSAYTTVKIPAKMMLGYFNIYDMTGKMIMNIEVSNTETIMIERADIASGSYIYSLKSNDKIVARGKLIVSN